jgi:hypothetical protein
MTDNANEEEREKNSKANKNEKRMKNLESQKPTPKSIVSNVRRGLGFLLDVILKTNLLSLL